MKAVEHVHQKARFLQDEIASLRLKARDTADPEHWAEIFCRPYYDLLRDLYAEEMALAHAIDSSDLLVHAEGPSLADDSPRLTLVEQFFANLRTQVLKVTKAVAGLDEAQRLRNSHVELGLSGLAPGSLYIGVRVKLPTEPSGQLSVLGEHDPLFVAARTAIRAIKIVSQHFDERADLERELPDPQVRDAAMVAISRLAPTKQSGVSRVTFDAADPGKGRLRELTPTVRRELNKELRQPVLSQETATIRGEVREIDLDARRFELRRIETGGVLNDVRCAYGESETRGAKHLLGRRVEVTGRIERLANGSPRLISVDRISTIDSPE